MKRKTGSTRPRSRGDAGQGTIEYILILVITVIIVMTILHQFSGAFRKYADAFFDGYIACLLETGELPGRANAVCESEYIAFNMRDGREAVRGTINGDPVASSGSSSSPPSGRNMTSVPSNVGSGAGSGQGGSGDGAGGASGPAGETARSAAASGSSSSGGSSGGSGFLKSKSTPVGKTAAASKEDAAVASNDALLGRVSSSAVGSANGRGDKKTQLERSFSYAGEQYDNDRAAGRPAVAQVAKTSEGNDSLRPKKTTVTIGRAPTNATMKDEEGFSFAYFLRMLMIIAIIIAIVVFFGGQLQQIWKGQEK